MSVAKARKHEKQRRNQKEKRRERKFDDDEKEKVYLFPKDLNYHFSVFCHSFSHTAVSVRSKRKFISRFGNFKMLNIKIFKLFNFNADGN
jgi:acetyl-CoA carboxylase beta subunit